MKRSLKTDELPPQACQLLKINSGRVRGQSDKENWAELSTIVSIIYLFLLFFLSAENVKKPTEVTRGVQTSRRGLRDAAAQLAAVAHFLLDYTLI